MPRPNEVRIGAPDQLVTGAIKYAPLGTTLPTLENVAPAAVELDAAFQGNEYVSADGLTLTPEYSVGEIPEWGGAIVRRPFQSANYTLSWTMISTNESAMGVAFGSDNVTANAATATHGTQLRVALGAHQPEPQSWVFLMKDGNARIVIVVPNGQVTEVGAVTFNSSDAVGWNVTLSAYPDEDGNNAYILTDDGVTAVSAGGDEGSEG